MTGGRPDRVVVVTGTATEVGKTWVSCRTLELARQCGLSVAARKPAQSFEPGSGPTDADLLSAASGEAPSEVCPDHRSYPVPMAPPMAAEYLGLEPPTLASLVAEIASSWPAPGCNLAIVEGAGGVASPLATDGHTADLAAGLAARSVVLVADAGLGVINSVRLSAGLLAPRPVVVHLNRFDERDDLHRRNATWLAQRDGFVLTTSVGALLDHLLSSP